MTDEIEVPVIEIVDGWTVDEIETEDDCDDAFAVLTAAIVGIEARMDDLEMQGEGLSVGYKKCRSALRWKKAGLQVVQTKRGKIKRAQNEITQANTERRMVNYFSAMYPGLIKEAMNHIRATTDVIATKRANPTTPDQSADAGAQG